jgi:hypothetical protein
VYVKGQCSFKLRVDADQYNNAVKTESIWISYKIEIWVKNLSMTKKFFFTVLYSWSPSGIDTVVIPYGHGSKSGCL